MKNVMDTLHTDMVDTADITDDMQAQHPKNSLVTHRDTKFLSSDSINEKKFIPQSENVGINQGFHVITDDSACEVVINGKVYGKGEQVFVALDPGTYTVAARKIDCFEDYERETLHPGEVTTVTVRSKVIRPMVVPPSYSVIIAKEVTMHGMQTGYGLWYKRHLFNGFFANGFHSGWSSPWGADSAKVRNYGTSYMNIAGVHYMYTAVFNRQAQLCFGLTTAYGLLKTDIEYSQRTDSLYYYDERVGWTKDVTIQTNWEYTHLEKDFLLFGPRMAFFGGFEHVKAMIAGSYLIRSDSKGVVADARNFYMIQAGMSIVF